MKIKLRTQKRDIKIVNRTTDVKRRFRVKNIRTLQQGMKKITPEQKQEHTAEANATEEIFRGGMQLAKEAIPHRHSKRRRKQEAASYASNHPPIRRYSKPQYSRTPAPHSVPGRSSIAAEQKIRYRASPQTIRTAGTNKGVRTVRHTRPMPKTRGAAATIRQKTMKPIPTQVKSANTAMKHRVIRSQQNLAAIAVAKQKAKLQATKRVQAALKTSIQAVARAMSRTFAAILGGAGGMLAPLVVVLLLAALVCSPLGLFLNREADNELTLQHVMSQLNTEFSDRIQEIENTVAHDDKQQTGQRTSWNEILTVYAVKATTQSSLDVVSMDEEHAEILKKIFWDMTSIRHSTEVYIEEETVEVPTEGSADEDGMVEETRTVEKTRLIITVSGKTAQQMAEEYSFTPQQIQYVTELLSEEYKEFWTLMSTPGGGSSDIVAVAQSQLGNVGGQPYWSWYGFSSRVEWCAAFVSWCADQCGYIDAGIVPMHAYCPSGVQWFRSRGQWQDRSTAPQPGWIIYFDWSGGSEADHVGIVESCDGSTVYTIEGNSSDVCRRRSYPVGWYQIMGYGTPRY